MNCNKNTVIEKVESIDFKTWKHFDDTGELNNELEELTNYLQECKVDHLKDLSGSQVKIYNSKQLTMKLAGNGQYGATTASGFRLYNPHIGEAITSQGVEVIILSQELVENLGYEVIYGDTDSMFIRLDEHIPDEIKEKGDNEVKKYILENIVPRIYEHLNKKLNEHAINVGISPHRKHYFEMKQEMIGRKMLLLQDRAGKGYAKKRYLIHIIDEEGVSTDKIKAVGVELRRSETPKFIKDRLWKFVEGFMKDTMSKQELTDYLIQIKTEIIEEVDKKNIHNIGRLLSVNIDYKDCDRVQQCYGSKLWNEKVAPYFNVEPIEFGQKVLIVPIKLKDIPETNTKELLDIYEQLKEDGKNFFVFNPIVPVDRVNDLFTIFDLDKDGIVEKMFFNQIRPYILALNISEDSLRYGLSGIELDDII